MAKATGFQVDYETGDIKMNAGDTGSFKVHASRKNGEDWPSDSRMLFTVKNQQGEILMQRIYRLDDQWGLGDGVVLIEFHNSDTDTWPVGTYQMERRYNVNPIWEGTPSDARCVDALTSSARMVEGVPVRTVFQGTLNIEDIYGEV
jgi:hypothetical protein